MSAPINERIKKRNKNKMRMQVKNNISAYIKHKDREFLTSSQANLRLNGIL